ncbi:MAG: sialidase family protein [Planctomycetota bacterium]
MFSSDAIRQNQWIASKASPCTGHRLGLEKTKRTRCVLLAAIGFVWANGVHANEPVLLETRKIWNEGKHNAFTDLVRFRGEWFCTFREAEDHVGGDGKIRVITSPDGEAWRSAALIAEEGIDLRDPKFSVTPDNRLMIVAGGSVYGGTKVLKARQPRVLFTKDGAAWTPPIRVLQEGEWLWRVTWHDGKAYGVSYNASAGRDAEVEWRVQLVASDDGVHFEPVTTLDVKGHPNETTVRFTPDGEMIAFMRREAGSKHAYLGVSKPPYKEWKWTETKHAVGGPNFLIFPDGSMWGAGRSYPGGARTVLAKMTRESYDPVLSFPSGGDNSYPGLVWREGLLWMSYYSSHEGKTSIYLAKIRLPE